MSLEPRLKALAQERVQRGKLELALRATLCTAEGVELSVSEGLAGALVGALRRLQGEHGLAGELRVADIARFPGVIEQVESTSALDEPLQRRLLELAAEAIEALDAMRRSEGGLLLHELRQLLEAVLVSAERLERLSAASREARREATLERVRGLAAELGLDDARVYQEVVRQAERSDVAEELQRLRSHVAQAHALLAAAEPVGKRLDFLAQELMREANTIGSKAAAAPMIREVVELKATVERVREQVQNVE